MSTFISPPNTTTAPTSSRFGSRSSLPARCSRTSTPASANAFGATPKVSLGSWPTRSTGFTRSVYAAQFGGPAGDGSSLSAPLEVALQLPVGHAVVVEDDLLLDCGVEQVFEHE